MNSAWHGNEDIMAEKVDYGTLKKGGFMRQKQKNNFSLRLAVVGGYLTAENLTKIGLAAPVATIFGIVLNVVFYIWCDRKDKAKHDG